MSGEAVVSFVTNKLGDLLIEEALLLHGVRDQIEWIEMELEEMRCFLKDADNKQNQDERIRNWVAQITDISYDAEDVIDTFISKVARQRGKGFVRLLKRYSCIFNELITRHKIGKEIQRIKKRINHVSSNREKYGIRDINEGRLVATSTNLNLHDRRRNFVEMLKEQDVVGFEEDRKTIKEQVINGDSRRAVISIVGMGGSGKTTLAKKVYHEIDPKAEVFECRAFIYLSEQYEIKDILIRIIKCVMNDRVSREEMEKANKQDLVKKLSDHLTGKRYLVVIDDIWTKEAWDALNLALPDCLNKSRVMLTTRKREVALHADPSSHPLEISLLDDSESWELFIKKVFPQGSSCPSQLEKKGRQLLAKCGRLPLAIVVLGGLLSRRDKTLSAWSKVLESVTWHLAESSNECRDILALSYYDLPHYLKPCFLYLGLFPEDFEIKSKRLIKLWIAEGFIQQRGSEILEDVAEDYLEELIGRSMLQVASKRSNGSVSTCRIHDLLHDISISEANQNNFFKIITDVDIASSSTRKCRRLALHHDIGKSIKTLDHSTTTLRSMLCFWHCEVNLLKFLSKCGKLLRVFDAHDKSYSEMDIAKDIGEFVHLRYLSFGKEFIHVLPSSITKLPSSIAKLHNLQTLEFKFYCIVVLPNEIWDLERLRHLYAYSCEIEGQPRLNNLRNLQTLCLLAGSWIEDGLDKLTNLRKLGVFGDIGSFSKSISSSVEKLCSLRSLTIRAAGRSVVPFMSLVDHSYLYKMNLCGPLEKLPECPPTLVKLTLRDSQLQIVDTMILQNSPQHVLNLLGDWTCSETWIYTSSGFYPLTLRVDCKNLKHIATEGVLPDESFVHLFNTKDMITIYDAMKGRGRYRYVQE